MRRSYFLAAIARSNSAVRANHPAPGAHRFRAQVPNRRLIWPAIGVDHSRCGGTADPLRSQRDRRVAVRLGAAPRHNALCSQPAGMDEIAAVAFEVLAVLDPGRGVGGSGEPALALIEGPAPVRAVQLEKIEA